jgi:hypothetical protein
MPGVPEAPGPGLPRATKPPDDTGTAVALRIGFMVDANGCRIVATIDTLTPIR